MDKSTWAFVIFCIVLVVAIYFGYGVKATGALEFKEPRTKIITTASASIEVVPPAK